MSKIGHVLSSSPEKVSIEITNLQTFEENKHGLQVGKFLKIEDGNHNYAVATINNVASNKVESDGNVTWNFVVEASPVGALLSKEYERMAFQRGTQVLPVPTERAHTFSDEDLALIFSDGGEYKFEIGHLSGNAGVPFFIDGDRFFGKHIGIVGSTGSGKSCAVASLIQRAVGISEARNLHKRNQKNSHVIVFDIHSEYSSAFSVSDSEGFNLNRLNVDTIKLPYWLMNSEELESLFIDSNESNSHNQISQFKQAVILNKERHNPYLGNL